MWGALTWAAVLTAVVPATAALPACPPPADSGAGLAAPAETAATEGPSVWYGGPAVAADAASLVLMLDGAVSNDGGALVFGLTAFVLGAPINHLAHGRPGRALASLGLRTLAVGAATGVALEDLLVNHCDSDVARCRNPDYAIAIDTVIVAGVMALDDVYASAPGPGRPPGGAETTLTPGLLVGPSTAFVSLGGRF